MADQQAGIEVPQVVQADLVREPCNACRLPEPPDPPSAPVKLIKIQGPTLWRGEDQPVRTRWMKSKMLSDRVQDAIIQRPGTG
jgi:hypothetical protein